MTLHNRDPDISATWALMKHIVNIATNIARGTIFGGYNRDVIIHEYYCKTKNNELLHYDYPVHDIHGHTRVMLPHDVDVYLPRDKIDVFKDALISGGLCFKSTEDDDQEDQDACKYIYTQPTLFKLSKYAISYKHSILGQEQVVVNVDVIYLNNANANANAIANANASYGFASIAVKPEFGPLDFECNAIVLTPDNEYKLPPSLTVGMTAYEKADMMTRIIKDICQMKTRLVNASADRFRIDAFLAKGWEIQGDCLSIVNTGTIKPKDVCFICLDNFEHDDVQVKMKCCTSVMHSTCSLPWKENVLDANANVIHGKDKCPYCATKKGFVVSDKDKVLMCIV